MDRIHKYKCNSKFLPVLKRSWRSILREGVREDREEDFSVVKIIFLPGRLYILVSNYM